MLAKKPDPATGKPDPAKINAFRASYPDSVPPADFLERNLIERVKRGPVCWGMILTIGAPGDPEDNPTVPWLLGRKEIQIGTLTISATTPQASAACEKINFDPLVMAGGIESSSDPVLLFRSPACLIKRHIHDRPSLSFTRSDRGR